MAQFPMRFGRYDLLDLLSTGGMAEVYLARSASHDQSSLRPLAVKRVLPYLSKDQDFIHMFEKEIGVTFHLNHPNIVKICDSGYIEGQYFIAMEYVEGRTLHGIFGDPEKMKDLMQTPFACYAIREVCKALQYAHSYRDPVTGNYFGITHRDISPHNILVAYDGSIKLFDFGIAKGLMKEGSTTAGVIKGKPAYVSPEQVLGKNVDSRTDIFSLGVVFWEFLTGRRLFFHEQPLTTFRNIVEQEILPPSQFNSSIPTELDAIVLKALSRDPYQRYQLVEELGDELQKLLDTRYHGFSESHASWLLRYLFEQEMKERHEDIEYRMRYQGSVEKIARQTLPPSLPKSHESTRKPQLPIPTALPLSAKREFDNPFEEGLQTMLTSDLRAFIRKDIQLKFSFRLADLVIAITFFALGALVNSYLSNWSNPSAEHRNIASEAKQNGNASR